MANEVVKYEEQWGAAAQKASSREETGGSFIKLAGGIFKLGEDELPGNKLCAIVLFDVHENTYYDEKWTPDGPVKPPRCFALAENKDDLEPHPAMEQDLDHFYPQSYDEATDEVGPCSSCPKNEWGSADTGKGKACGNRRRLGLLQAGEYVKSGGKRGSYEVVPFDDEDDYKNGEITVLKLPVTSGKSYSRFVKECQAEFNRPTYGVIAEITVRPDPKSQFVVEFEILDALPDDWFPMIQKRHEEAKDIVLKPYDPPTEEETQAAQPNRISGLRRK